MHIRVKVHTEARKECVKKHTDERYEIWVKEAARTNAANIRTREFVAEILNTSIRKVRLVSGHRSTSKIFEVIGD